MNYTDLTFEQKCDVTNKDVSDMTEEEMIQYCEYACVRWNLDFDSDMYFALEAMIKKSLCHLRINSEYIDKEERKQYMRLLASLSNSMNIARYFL